MTGGSPSLDPYRSPSLPEGPYAGQPPSGRPGLLTALCVLCIVLGALGLMNSLFGAVGAVAGPKLQAAFQPKPSASMPPEMRDAQLKFQQEVNDVQTRHFVPIVVALGARFVAALLLLVGGIQALGLKESGRKVLLAACSVAIAFELGHAILQSMIWMEMMTTVNSFAESMIQSLPQGKAAPPGFSGMMRTIIRGSIIAQIVIASVLVLAKCGMYLFGLIYLQKAAVRSLFRPAG